MQMRPKTNICLGSKSYTSPKTIFFCLSKLMLENIWTSFLDLNTRLIQFWNPCLIIHIGPELGHPEFWLNFQISANSKELLKNTREFFF
jgi:hypothetical protein